MLVYATPDDLAAEPWNLVPTDPQAAYSLLARAATIIRGLTITAIYATDPDGKATDPKIAAALRDATCAQAVWFDETGDTGSGATGRFNSMSLGSASLSGGGTGSGTNTSVDQGRYSPEAVQILQNTGLLTRQAQSW